MTNSVELPYTQKDLEYFHEVVDALSKEYREKLRRLRKQDTKRFDSVIDEIEKDMDCTFKRDLWEE